MSEGNLRDLCKLILAIDISNEFGSLALADGLQLLEEVPLHSSDGFSHLLFGEMSQLLKRHDVAMRDIACFAAAAGPGTFTGIRMGLTTAMGLAEACKAKVVAVSNLQALAWFGVTASRAPVIDARRGDVYGGFYNSALETSRDEIVATVDQWLAMVPADAEVITNGKPIDPQGRMLTHAPRELARAVASIAAGQYAKGLAQDPGEVDANYVRRSDAANMWRDSR